MGEADQRRQHQGRLKAQLPRSGLATAQPILAEVPVNLSTKDLKAVLFLSQSKSFGQAALQMHLSQSALSALIARLEAQLGAQLFARTTRAVELTDAGRIFVSHASDLLRDTERALRAVSDTVQLKTGSVTVAALPSLAASLLPKIFAEFSAAHPQVRLSLLDTQSRHAFDLVRDGKVDFALTAADPQQEDLTYEQLTTDQFLLICAKDHALHSRSCPIALEDTLDYAHISMPTTASVRQYIDADLLTKGCKFNPAFEVDHIATIGALVGAGLGISALPETALALLKAEQLVRIPLAGAGIKRPLGLLTRRHAAISIAAQQMCVMLKNRLTNSN